MDCRRKWARHRGRSWQRPPPLLLVPTECLLFEVAAEEEPENGSLWWGGEATGYGDRMQKAWRSGAGEQLTPLWVQLRMFLVQKEALKEQFRAIFLPKRGLGDQNRKHTLKWACEETRNHWSPDCQATAIPRHFGLAVKSHSGLLLSPRARNGRSREAASCLPRQWQGRVWSSRVGWHKRLNTENALWCPAVCLYLAKSPKSVYSLQIFINCRLISQCQFKVCLFSVKKVHFF